MSELMVVCVIGKRKSGKDYCAIVLKKILEKRFGSVEIRRISDPLKEEYAKLKGVDAECLKTDGPEKEKVRAEMIKFGEYIRSKDPGYFCRKCTEDVPKNTNFLIISDCRRPSDLQFFRRTFPRVFVVRVIADVETRARRGFVFKSGVDDAESECALDLCDHVDSTIDNSHKKPEALDDCIERLCEQLLTVAI